MPSRADESFTDVIAQVSLRLASATDDQLDGAIDTSLALIGAHEGAHRAYIIKVHDDRRFSNTHEWVAGGVESHRSTITDRSLDEFPWSSALLEAGHVWHCPDVSLLPPDADAERSSFAAFGVISVLEVPMRSHGHLIGALGINHVGELSTWTNDNIERLRRLSDAIGFALLRRRANRQVARARDEAERANRAKGVLLANVSHELRTPLHAILGFAELLDDPSRAPFEREALRQIIDSGTLLLGLVDELLDTTARSTEAQAPIE